MWHCLQKNSRRFRWKRKAHCWLVASLVLYSTAQITVLVWRLLAPCIPPPTCSHYANTIIIIWFCDALRACADIHTHIQTDTTETDKLIYKQDRWIKQRHLYMNTCTCDKWYWCSYMEIFLAENKLVISYLSTDAIFFNTVLQLILCILA